MLGGALQIFIIVISVLKTTYVQLQKTSLKIRYFKHFFGENSCQNNQQKLTEQLGIVQQILLVPLHLIENILKKTKRVSCRLTKDSKVQKVMNLISRYKRKKRLTENYQFQV